MVEYRTPPLDRVFHALADPTRMALVDRLIRGEASVSELAAPLDMSLAAVMQHLSILEDNGIIRSHKSGRTRTCRVDGATLGRAAEWLARRRDQWAQHLDRLGELLAEPPRARKPQQKRRRR